MKIKCPNCDSFNTQTLTPGLICNECNYPIGINFITDEKGIYFLKDLGLFYNKKVYVNK